MKLSDKLQQAVNALILNHPFYASMLLRQRIIADAETKTASVDGQTLRYNPEFVAQLSHAQLVGLLAHEILHLANLHHCRRNGRVFEKWNRACDYAVNPLLRDAGFTLPEGALFDPQFAGKSAEEIYRVLPDEQQENQAPGEVGDSPEPDKERVEAETRAQVKQSLARAQAAGMAPEAAERAYTDSAPRADWREILALFVADQAPIDHSWSAPNRRFLSQGIILPALKAKTIGNIVFAVDTSGSIQHAEIQRFAAELLNAVQAFEEAGSLAEIFTIYCDAEIQHTEVLTPFDRPNPKGGGGTDFAPVFEYVDRQNLTPTALVYFTDGYCASFGATPSYPVLWAVIGRREFVPPFGEVVFLDQI